MKQVILAIVLTMVSAGYAVLVDDFESYALGSVGDVASPPWQTTEASFYANIETDGTANHTMSQAGSGGYRDVSISLPFPITSTAVLTFDIYAKSDVNVDDAFGLTDGAAGTAAASDYDNFGPYIRFSDDTAGAADIVSLDIRDGAGFVDDVAALAVDRCYAVKLVIDTAGGDLGGGGFDVYVDNGLVYSNAGFRKPYTTALQSFMAMASSGSGGQILLDNIAVVPEPATLALLGLGGLTLLRKRR